MKPPKPKPPEVIGPATAIKRFFDRSGEPIRSADIKAMTSDERWDMARECVAEMDGVELEERK